MYIEQKSRYEIPLKLFSVYPYVYRNHEDISVRR
jgi:hypothetical protein